jgi:hypothetical protein
MTERKRAKKKPRKSAIVPRVVFQTVVAMSVVPAAVAVSGCGESHRVFSVADGGFSVAMPRDSGFGVAADSGPPRDANFGVADVGPPHDAAFSVAVPLDSGMFSVAMPLDSGMFGVAAEPDAGVFGVAARADEDAG